jgi:hypothetical protein
MDSLLAHPIVASASEGSPAPVLSGGGFKHFLHPNLLAYLSKTIISSPMPASRFGCFIDFRDSDHQFFRIFPEIASWHSGIGGSGKVNDGTSMKTCSYCGRQSDEAAPRCQECGTNFPVEPSHRHERSSPLQNALRFSAPVAGGSAVVIICTGMVVASRRLFPGIYALSFSLLAWMVVMGFVALALTLHAGGICCRTRLHRAAFTLVVFAILAAEGAMLFPGETGLGSRGSSVVVYGSSALMVVGGAITLARIAGQRKLLPTKEDASLVIPIDRSRTTSRNPSRPAFSITEVIAVLATLLFLSFLAFWIWVYVTPHW